MSVHVSRKGLDLPILGEPGPGIHDHDPPRHVALLAADFPGLRPTMHVAEGDEVRRGQLLLEDKKTPGVRFTSPGAGKVIAVHRGERRAFQAVMLELSSADRSGRVGAADQDPDQYSHHRPAYDYCVARHRHRSSTEGLRLRDLETALGFRRPHHHELHHHGASRGLRHAKPAGNEHRRRYRKRAGLCAHSVDNSGDSRNLWLGQLLWHPCASRG